jgi:small subunit ribosomal protein S8
MAITDPIADMLTRLRNAVMVRHDSVMVPSSKVKIAIAKILQDEGFIIDYEVVKGKPHRMLKIHLKYDDKGLPVISGLERMSRPGLKLYVQKKEVPRVYGGIGIAIISTSKGIMTGHEARRQGIGGELLCQVW